MLNHTLIAFLIVITLGFKVAAEESTQEVQAESYPARASQAPDANQDARTYLSIGLEHSAANSVSSKATAGAKGITVSETSKIDTDTALTIFAEAGIDRPKDLGGSVAISYDTNRDDGSGAKFSIWSLQVNATYQFNKIKAFLGPNYSSVDYSPIIEAGQSFEIKGAIGYQYGFEFALSDRTHLRAFWRSIMSDVTTEVSGINVRGNFKLEGLQVGLRYNLW